VITGSDVAMLAMPGNAHRMAIEAIAGNLRDGQPTIISSHLSFGALYLSLKRPPNSPDRSHP